MHSATLGQGHEALAAEHDLGVLPAREGQAEVIQPMIERCAGDADALIPMPVKSDNASGPAGAPDGR